ncbi:MAG: uroporphyrinogen-III decarboxylase [Solidesulfovibrio magneticus str. Maddingley MBC34]|uniref:Uroporphyrinogen-III decarboxylase n=1 Tax=Solidesulfovibrio magneticus str. Maddingley MBC34 TaxID=1206767 RepID=K6GFA4_9BACT|nr:MAG: uroporphyrinogen-III decarboxylase [Solidesulfovibrio magneticus str. Maddingley MBC34]
MTGQGCGHLDAAGQDAALARELGLSFPEVHVDGPAMARLARAVRRRDGAAVCRLPFCCTVEAQALGAAIRLGDAAAGPRPGPPVRAGLAEILAGPSLDPTRGRPAQVLAACAALAAAGEPVALEIAGPITILSALADLTAVLKDWRRDPALMEAVLGRLLGELASYAREAGRCGVALVSLADPAGTVSILGPRRFAALAEGFTLPWLRLLRADPDFAPGLHVCPKTARGLVEEGLAGWRKLPLDRPAGYAEACLALGPGGRVFGQACLSNPGARLPDGLLRELVVA